MTSQTSELCRNLLEALNPVRDVTKNWGIDLAQHLEQYLEKIAIDHAENPMNFAEAALLIQNSTTIYSKKVDYIWDIMQCVLANIHKKKQDSKSSEKLNETGNSDTTGTDDTSNRKRSRKHNVLDRTKYGEINTEISGKILDLEASKEKRKPWKFIPTIYHQFQKKSISRKAKHTRATPDDPHEDRKFKVNLWLLLYKMLHHEFKDEGDALDSANCFQNSLSIIDHNDAFPTEHMDDHMDDSVSHGGQDDPFENAEPHLDAEQLAETCAAEAAQRREKDNLVTVATPPPAPPPPPPVVNAWDPIPFDQGILDKEIGHRTTTKLPCDIELLEPPPENGKRKKGKEMAPREKQKLLSKYLQLKSMLKKDMKKQFLLDQDFLLQRDIMAQLNRTSKKPIKFAEIRHELDQDFDEFADFLGFEDYENTKGDNGAGFLGFGDHLDNISDDNNDNDNDMHADSNDIAEPLNIDIPLPTNNLQELPPDIAAVNMSPGGSSSGGTNQAFEAMCLERIQPQKTTEEIIRGQVDLAKRVAHWHDTIKPMLAASEKRAHFDIHEYGTQILNTFPKNSGAKTTLPLKKVLENVDTQDVSRYFLAMLQLANTYNVEITTPKEPLVVDQVELTLLTASRLHEDLDNYVAPSQERTSISGSSRSPESTSFQFAQPTLPRPKTTSTSNITQRKRKL